MDSKTREQRLIEIETALIKKKRCITKAVRIVEKLLENSVTQEELIESCFYINQEYLKDVVEERGILLKCGYPLCVKHLDKITNKKYHISSKCNKVYDLTERKYFCSNFCYKAFKYLESQLPTCLLWLLDEEGAKEIRLLSSAETVEQKSEPIEKNENSKQKIEPSYKSAASEQYAETSATKTESYTETENAETEVNQNENELTNDLKKLSVSTKKEQKMPTKLSNVRTPGEVAASALKDWITSKTLQLLFSPEQYADLLKTKSIKCKNESDEQKCLESKKANEDLNSVKFENVDDIALDLSLAEVDCDIAKKMVPSYEQILRDSKDGLVNVRLFYKGEMKLFRSESVQNEEENLMKNKKTDEGDEEITTSFYAPLVDSRSQNALRTRIVLEKVNKSIVEILDMLKIPLSLVTVEFREITHTFRLQAQNITFKPQEWVLIALMMLHMVAIKDLTVRDVLAAESSRKIITNLLQLFNLDLIYLESTLKRLIDSIIDQNVQ